MVDLRAESAATISQMTYRLWTIRAPHALAISHQIVYQLRVQQASLGIVVESAAMTFRVLVSKADPNYPSSNHFCYHFRVTSWDRSMLLCQARLSIVRVLRARPEV